MKYCKFCMSKVEDNDGVCTYCKKKIERDVPTHHLSPFTVLKNRYMVGTAIGEGGFGITYIGRDTLLDIKVAIKEFYPYGYVNRNASVTKEITMVLNDGIDSYYKKGLNRFLSEARIMAKFSNEDGIVNVRDYFEENKTAYIVMEYLDGEDLKSYLRKHKKLYPEETLELLMPIMISLKKVHIEGLIHRDISPENIRLVSNGVKLLDFGAAKDISAIAQKSLSVVLKPGYAPEEQYRSKGTQGPWTDVYALCATMYKCITGLTPIDSIQRIVTDDLKRPSELGIEIDDNFENALMKGLEVFQKNRHQTVDELLNAFNYNSNKKLIYKEQSDKSNDDSKPVLNRNVGDECVDEVDRRKKSSTDNEENIDTVYIKKVEQVGSNPKKTQNRKNVFFITAFITVVSVVMLGLLWNGNFSKNNQESADVQEDVVDEDLNIFTGKSVTNDQLIASFRNVNNTYLTFQDCNFVDLQDKVLLDLDLSHINKLSLINTKGIKDFSFISNLKNATDITINGCELTSSLFDKINFEKLDKLNFLVLDNNSLNNITKLKGLKTKLKKLSISNTNILDISGIDALNELSILYAENCKINDVNILSKFKSMKKLNLKNANISDISFLEEMKYITHINLSDNKIKSLDVLNDHLEIEVLNVANNQLQDLKGISNSGMLKEIDISNNKLNGIEVLSGKKYIEKAFLDNCGIKDLSSLDKTKGNIKYLSARNNYIEDATCLTTFSNLELLRLDGNLLTYVDLRNNKELKNCTLSNNRLSAIDLTHNCPFVLDVSYNKLKDINFLKNCRYLDGNQYTYLNISHNELESFIYDSQESADCLGIHGNKLKDVYVHYNSTWGTLFINYYNDLESKIDKTGILNYRDVKVVECPNEKKSEIQCLLEEKQCSSLFVKTSEADKELNTILESKLIKPGYWY